MEDGVNNGSQYWNGYDGVGWVDGHCPEARLSVSWNDLLYEGQMIAIEILMVVFIVAVIVGAYWHG